MQPKKNPKVDLEKKRGLFMQIGLILSLLIVLGVFEFRTYEKVVASLGELVLDAEFEEVEIEDTESDEDLEVIEEEEETTDEIFMVVEDMPRFEGCTDENCTQTKIMQFIARKTKYPPIAKENNITGRVFVSFVVDKTGIVTNVKILRGVDKYLDAEALRVVSSLPRFTPGKQRGKSVKVQYNVPISFKLN
ncbi:energy transducer TonB [Flavobacteriales bacterium]|nr:energy transducer TonB [Flavobacteriales bacterium]